MTKKKKRKKKKKGQSFCQKPPEFWEGQSWYLELCATWTISVSALGRMRAAELFQQHCPPSLYPKSSHCLCLCWLLFCCHGSCYRASACALLCTAQLSYLLGPGWLLMTGETLVISLLEAKLILSDKWSLNHITARTARKAKRCSIPPMSSSTALGMARDNFILTYVTWSKPLVLVVLPCVFALSLTLPDSPCPSKPSLKIPLAVAWSHYLQAAS